MVDNQEEIIKIKILALGLYGVGRRSIINRFLENKYEENHKLSQYMSKNIILKNNQQIKVDFYIHNRGEKFYQLRPLKILLKNIQGFILAYSIDSKYSFESLSEAIEWIQIIDIDYKKIPTILIGNQLDKNENREVPTEEAQSFANNNGFFAFYETSAKENINVNESLNALIEKICEENAFFPAK